MLSLLFSEILAEATAFGSFDWVRIFKMVHSLGQLLVLIVDRKLA